MELPKSLTTVTTLSKILAGILFVLLPFIGFYLGMKYQTSTSPAPTSVKTPTTTPDPTVGWETYTNTEYGFSFKHPNLDDKCCGISGPASGNFSLSKTFADVDTVSPGGDKPFAGIGVHVVTDIPSFENYIIQEKVALNKQYEAAYGSDPNHKGVQTPTTLNGQTGYVLKGYSWDNVDRYYIPFPNSNNILIVSLGKALSERFSYDQILSTFRFIASPYEENNLPETSIRTIQHSVIPSWETYSNEFTGLTLQYPPGFRQISEEKQGKECVLSFGNDAGGVLYVKIVPYAGGSRRELYGINTGYTYSFEDVYIQGLKSLIIEAGPIGDSGSGSGIVIPKGKNALIISISNRAKDDEWFQNILKSIKITELTGSCG